MDIPLDKRPAGTFYTGGVIQGYGRLDMLVDTGSSILVIDENILSQLVQAGEAEYSRQLGGLMADGTQRHVPVYRVHALRVGDNCWIRNVEAAVFPAGSRAILGMNVLTRLAPFTFSADPPQLQLNQCLATPAEAMGGTGGAPVAASR
ncbi:MAG TPA: retropepsin-like aspartic protease [Nevskiaceae bacterium]|nr:retropepsin-like aspartic protease [Nevskiaceae bacterium]